MWIVAVAAGMLSLIVANSFYIEYMTKEIPWNASDSARDVSRFHVFAAAAEIYMRDHATDTSFLPTGTTVVRWETVGAVIGLRNARGLSPALANVNSIDPAWSVRITGGSYVLCTGMTTGGVVKMAKLPESPVWNPSTSWEQRNTTVTVSGTPVPAVSFDVDAAGAASCNS